MTLIQMNCDRKHFYPHMFENSVRGKEPGISFQRVGRSRGGPVRPGLSTSSPVLSQTLWCLRCLARAQEAHSVEWRHPHMAAYLPAKHHQSGPRSFHLAVPHCPSSCSFDLVRPTARASASSRPRPSSGSRDSRRSQAPDVVAKTKRI